MVSIADSVLVVTGGASGIGRSVALEFADEGASVVVTDVDEDGLEEVVDEIDADGGEAISVVGDVADPDSVEVIVDRATEAYGTIDVLCNNAGVFDDFASLEEADEALWDTIVDVNLKSVFLLTKEALPALTDGESEGVVVNVSSVAGKVAGGGGVAYTSSKHGLIGFTRQLSYDYGPEIRANAICPGFIETRMTEDLIEETPDEVDELVQATPARRYADPAEVASVVRFLASDEASFMHGAAVDVDGGWLVD
ncbi:SDR family NAD(P)-dependent oxidoreductase [Natrialbaceae archaeon AArc-T1-2]|uniref:SDR family NAD(P)-dependent oxidoreductase n=1 Tax=Natrialbaceae archaeon AArc-T1-2 TaxID=3053904 RepID=UPI00255AD595|nr:SDR family NAD(P)-dependent oxidoreductase [Natrialbaceae archaeon AArc-T1-2]WIV66904.1 SDR family NAD(P)-dependent oxidoreductase [Natrialbaceae archaeon AArc-T1-2]